MLLLNDKLGNNYLVLLINLNPSYSIMHTYTLIDSNGSAIISINKYFITPY